MDYVDVYGAILVLSIIAGVVLDQRRKPSVEDFERMRRDRKVQVERAARKAL
ncbi:hypothetical protein Q1J45_10440 [Pseudomonas rhodesiae]